MSLLEPSLAILALVALGTLLGYLPTRRIIAMREAHHELKRGSASFLRATAGWAIIALWVMALWFGGTIVGDWIRLGDLDAAIARSWLRLRILLEIAAAIGSD
ncbi:MAG: hypothetical protein AAFM92_05355 [Pseudomonadota bacterium]